MRAVFWCSLHVLSLFYTRTAHLKAVPARLNDTFMPLEAMWHFLWGVAIGISLPGVYGPPVVPPPPLPLSSFSPPSRALLRANVCVGLRLLETTH
jgi:hypothetical protein